MIVNSKFVSVLKTSMLLLVACLFFQQCSEENMLATTTTEVATAGTTVSQSADLTTIPACSSCTYVVPANTYNIDGTKLGLKPGAVICLNSAIGLIKLPNRCCECLMDSTETACVP